MKNYYIADLHFYHKNVIGFDNRPFKDVVEMNEKLIYNWNNIVNPEDNVYIIGDFGFFNSPNQLSDIAKRLTGKKHLIVGNHDTFVYDKKYKNVLNECFASIHKYLEVNDKGRNVILCHYPILFYKKSYKESYFMLCGHVHIKNEAIQLESFIKSLRDTKDVNSHSNLGQIYNVGCMRDGMGYTPRLLNEIIKIKKG